MKFVIVQDRGVFLGESLSDSIEPSWTSDPRHAHQFEERSDAEQIVKACRARMGGTFRRQTGGDMVVRSTVWVKREMGVEI